MSILLWIAAFTAICAVYTVEGFWALGLVLHCLLVFSWLVTQTGRAPRE